MSFTSFAGVVPSPHACTGLAFNTQKPAMVVGRIVAVFGSVRPTTDGSHADFVALPPDDAALGGGGVPCVAGGSFLSLQATPRAALASMVIARAIEAARGTRGERIGSTDSRRRRAPPKPRG